MLRQIDYFPKKYFGKTENSGLKIKVFELEDPSSGEENDRT